MWNGVQSRYGILEFNVPLDTVFGDGVQSRWFAVVNGVKQGGVLSPVLFCVYIDGLLSAVSAGISLIEPLT